MIQPADASLLFDNSGEHGTYSISDAIMPLFSAEGLRKNKFPFWRKPERQMQGAATQAMPQRIVEERQRGRCLSGAAPRRAAARKAAGFVARSLHTAAGMRLARVSPSALRASSKMGSYSCADPKESSPLWRHRF